MTATTEPRPAGAPAAAVPAQAHRPQGAGPLGVALIGCGNISTQYLDNLTAFPDVNVVMCADLFPDRAAARAGQYGIGAWGSPADALAHPGVELIVNLTIPAAHAEVAEAALAAGKHVWNEKPLTDQPETARALLAKAAQAGLRVGCAPDTVLGPGLQSVRRLIAAGGIGAPLSALAMFRSPGPDAWHPDPAFLYARGAGPLFDMGPYYLSALAGLFGPVRRVAAVGRRAQESRTVGSGPKAGTSFPVEVPSYVSAVLEYRDGPTATLVFTFDSAAGREPLLEVNGTDAVLALPDPNRFDGALSVRRRGEAEWTRQEPAGVSTGRGVGVLDLARAVRAGRPHRASGELALHVLEVMTAVQRSAETGSFEEVDSVFTLPEAVPDDFDPLAATLAR